jgi:hypothetical protein
MGVTWRGINLVRWGEQHFEIALGVPSVVVETALLGERLVEVAIGPMR